MNKLKVLIAGIGGASLGAEIAKCLKLETGSYEIIGCDISPYAYGHYDDLFSKTFVINIESYIESIINICEKESVDIVVPGGEEQLRILATKIDVIKEVGTNLLINTPSVVDIFTDKLKTFEVLNNRGIDIPRTIEGSKYNNNSTISPS